MDERCSRSRMDEEVGVQAAIACLPGDRLHEGQNGRMGLEWGSSWMRARVSSLIRYL